MSIYIDVLAIPVNLCYLVKAGMFENKGFVFILVSVITRAYWALLTSNHNDTLLVVVKHEDLFLYDEGGVHGSGSAMDCRSTGGAIYPAPGA